MPPQAKFTRTEIIQKALEIVRTEGMDKITARELGNRLNSSARPIFTVFESMEEVKQEVVIQAKERYREYIERGLGEKLAFRGVGTAYITFAIEEPKLFALLFMQPQAECGDVTQILPAIDDSYEKILRSVQEPYGFGRATAEKIYQHLWIYTHGIASMCVANVCRYSMQDLTDRMTEIFKSLLEAAKRGEI